MTITWEASGEFRHLTDDELTEALQAEAHAGQSESDVAVELRLEQRDRTLATFAAERAAKSAKSRGTTASPRASDGGAKRYEDYTPKELHDMRASGPDGEARYQALRADWIARGRPAGKRS